MRRIVPAVIVTAMCLPACGTENPPVANVRVETGRDLGLGAADRIVQGFSVGVWQAVIADDVATITERHLVGEESGAGHRLVIDFAPSPPVVREISFTRDGDRLSSEPAGPGTLRLQDTDPAGILSGSFEEDDGRSFRFWVDTAVGTYVNEPQIGQRFTLRPGGVADSFLFATQFVEVAEDSRCPVDVQCVWEGRVVVRLRYVWESGVEEFDLVGLLTPDGPIFGDAPTRRAWPLGPGADREIALEGLEGDLATFVWMSIEE